MTENKIAIVGGGIAGLTMAIALQRKGFQTIVYETAPAIKPLGAGITLAGNAVKALQQIGLDQDVLQPGKILKSLFIKDQKGKILAFTDAEKLSKKLAVINSFSIHRADLHDILLSKLQPGTLILDKSLVDFAENEKGVLLKFADGTVAQSRYLIACDGIHSVVRQKLMPGSAPRYAGYTCWRAVIDMPGNIPSDETSETWASGKRFGIVPLANNKLYWFACINAKPDDPKLKKFSALDLAESFAGFHSPIPRILQNTDSERLIWSDIIDLKPLTQFHFGKILLTGDAAHATTPNMGQGACMAIEDAAVLINCLESASDIESAFARFERKRIDRTTKIVNDSWRIGRVAQLENPTLSRLRNGILRITPPRVTEKQIRFITDVNLA